jgi:GAF domain-containing protein
MQWAVGVLTRTLGVASVCLGRPVGCGRLEVAYAAGSLRAAAGEIIDLPEELVRSGAPPADPVRGHVVHLEVDGRPSLLVVLDEEPRRFSDADVDLLRMVAFLLAAAMNHGRREAAQALLSGFGRFALECRDIGATIARSVDLVCEVLNVPLGVLTQLLDHGGNALRYHRGAIGFPPNATFRVPADILATYLRDEPLVVPDWDAETRFERRPVLPPGVRSTIAATVHSGSRVWGRLTGMDTRPRQFTSAEADFVQSMANVLAAAMERDRIETRLRDATRRLQHALLPETLPALEGIEVAARYVPAGGSEVGGDWYDVLPLPDGGIGVVMGDVEGHDEIAAAVMGQVRNALRAYASEGHPPAAILNHVNRFVTVHTERLVTCCYLEVHPNEGSVTCATAGHAAPLVLAAAGAIRRLPLDPGLTMGVAREHDFVEHTALLPAAARLLLFTDGVVDDCTGVLHEGLDAFAGAVHVLDAAPLPELADGLVAWPADASPLRDDAALLVVRLTAPIADGGCCLHRVWPASSTAARAARCFVTDVLSDWRLPHLSDRAVPAVSELVANVVVHTASRIRLTVRRTAADRVWIGVHDTSDRWPGWSDPGWLDRLTALTAVARTDLVETAVSGRGLAIVAGLVDAWGVVPSSDLAGKTVWVELTGAGRPAGGALSG